MLAKLKQSWRRLKNGTPGRRFQEQYQARKRSGRPAWARPLWIGLGLVILVGGLAALPLPGPGMLVIALGGALLARELELAARAFDWLELRLRKVAAWSKKTWKRSPIAGKAGIVGVAVATCAAGGYLAWTWFLRDRFV